MMELIIWDVQHGSAAYLKTPAGKHIVIDLGTGNYSNGETGFSPLKHLKSKYQIKQLDEVIITHPHTDHIDDIMNFDSLNPKILTRPKHLTKEDIKKANPSKDQHKVEKYLDINQRYSVPVEDYENPGIAENNGGVTINTFVPSKCETSNINNHSIVVLIEYLGVKILVPGDNEAVSWKELLERKDFLDAIKNIDVFVASHHGRESGYYSELFKHFSPELVIVSDGTVQETSVTDKYSKNAKGWNVYKRSENEKYAYKRQCVTTRNDGTIIVKVGLNQQKVYMNVTID